MSIEKIVRKNSTKYRANIYWKGSRYTGKPRDKKKEAEKDERRMYIQLEDGKLISEKNITLDKAFKDYFEHVAPNRMSKTTIELYKTNFNNHLKPVLGNRKLNSIKPLEIQKLWTAKQKELSNASIIKLHSSLNQIYNYYVKADYITKNPLDSVINLQPNYKEASVWTRSEAHQFLEYSKEYQAHIAFWLALNFGLRKGECLGLYWSDIDFENKILYIKRSYNYRQKAVGALKTKKSKRAIYLSDSQISVLKNHKQSQEFKTKLVCSNNIGGFLMERNIRRAMDSICNKAGIKRLTFHELRHTHATFFLEMNESPKVISERLGHADVKTTLSIYQHMTPALHKESSDRFNDFFNS